MKPQNRIRVHLPLRTTRANQWRQAMELIKSGYSVTLRGPFAQLEVTGTTKELPAEEFRRVDRICKQALIEAKP